MKWLIAMFAFIAFVIVGGFYLVGVYNTLITLEQTVEGSWSEVNNQYQRQADLIPNLVSVVASAVTVETNFVIEVTEARTRWQTAQTPLDRDKAGIEMNAGIANLVNAVATAENYPTLQANTQYIALTDELAGTQNRITTARGRYIESIKSYNTALKRFPTNLIAPSFGFSPKDYYMTGQLTTPTLGSGQLP